LMWS